MPGLWARSLERQTHIDVSLPVFLPPFPSLKISKSINLSIFNLFNGLKKTIFLLCYGPQKNTPQLFPPSPFLLRKLASTYNNFPLSVFVQDSGSQTWESEVPLRAKEMVAVLEVKRMTPVGNRGLPQRERALCGPSGTSAVTWRLSHLTEITWTSLLFNTTFLLGGLHEKSPFLLCNLCQRKKLMIAPLHEEK